MSTNHEELSTVEGSGESETTVDTTVLSFRRKKRSAEGL